MSIRSRFSAAVVAGRCGAILAAVLIAAPALAIGDGTLVFSAEGVGVTGNADAQSPSAQIDFDAGSGNTEALAVDLGKDAVSAVVVVTQLIASEGGGEHGLWQAFDGVGQPVGSGLIDGTTLSGYDNGSRGTLTISGIGNFRYLVFTSLEFTNQQGQTDSSDYYVWSINVSYADQSPGSFGGSGSEQAWSGAGLSAFNFGTPFQDASGRFLGAAPAPIVVNDQECRNGQGTNNQRCEIPFTDRLLTTIAGEDINATIQVVDISTVVDTRAHCGFVGTAPTNPQWLPGAAQPVGITDGGLDLGFTLEEGVTGPIVPPHLCGIAPAPGENPQFVLVNLDSDIEISRSVIEHEVANIFGDAFYDYECATGTEVLADMNPPARRGYLPVIGWLPKTSNPEIPVLDGDGNLVPVLEDVTTGCGSSRGSTSRLSFLVYDLHHVDDADYHSIIREEIEQLKVTVDQTSVCIDSAQAKNLASRVRLALNAYDTGGMKRLSYAKKELGGLLSLVQSKRLDREFAQCGFDLEHSVVTRIGEFEEVAVPRNFRGDLTVQIQHILYMMDRMLGVTKP